MATRKRRFSPTTAKWTWPSHATVRVPKHQRRLAGLDEKILVLYARGLSTRDISAQLEELYGVTLSPVLISEVTDTVSDEVKAWQVRP